MPVEFNLDEAPQELPNFVLTKDDKKIEVSCMEVIKACTAAGTAADGFRAIQRYLMQHHNLRVPEHVAAMMFEEAEQAYAAEKKSCMKTPKSEGTDSTPTNSTTSNDSSS